VSAGAIVETVQPVVLGESKSEQCLGPVRSAMCVGACCFSERESLARELVLDPEPVAARGEPNMRRPLFLGPGPLEGGTQIVSIGLKGHEPLTIGNNLPSIEGRLKHCEHMFGVPLTCPILVAPVLELHEREMPGRFQEPVARAALSVTHNHGADNEF
jgi:hypothetical protein